jgi:hypothetical protein
MEMLEAVKIEFAWRFQQRQQWPSKGCDIDATKTCEE